MKNDSVRSRLMELQSFLLSTPQKEDCGPPLYSTLLCFIGIQSHSISFVSVSRTVIHFRFCFKKENDTNQNRGKTAPHKRRKKNQHHPKEGWDSRSCTTQGREGEPPLYSTLLSLLSFNYTHHQPREGRKNSTSQKEVERNSTPPISGEEEAKRYHQNCSPRSPLLDGAVFPTLLTVLRKRFF